MIGAFTTWPCVAGLECTTIRGRAAATEAGCGVADAPGAEGVTTGWPGEAGPAAARSGGVRLECTTIGVRVAATGAGWGVDGAGCDERGVK